jgi:hypothetical protein
MPDEMKFVQLLNEQVLKWGDLVQKAFYCQYYDMDWLLNYIDKRLEVRKTLEWPLRGVFATEDI